MRCMARWPRAEGRQRGQTDEYRPGEQFIGHRLIWGTTAQVGTAINVKARAFPDWPSYGQSGATVDTLLVPSVLGGCLRRNERPEKPLGGTNVRAA